jgi:hypothetical protein
MLDFLIDDVAGVSNKPPSSPDAAPPVEGYVARKAVSSFVDMAGMATLHVSPLAVLAILSDLAYGSRTYLHELARELKTQGIIDEKSTIDSTADLLEAISNTASRSADAFDTPPLSVDGLRETIAQTRQAIAGIDPAGILPLAEIDRTWREMSRVAGAQNVSLLDISSAMTIFAMNRMAMVTRGALSTIRVTGNLFDRHITDHYREGLGQIRRRGVYTIVAESSKPYVDALWKNFAGDRSTVTADVLSGKLPARAVRAISGWFRRGDSEEPAP